MIAQNIKEARERKGFTQEKLAEIIGINQSVVARYETGLKVPSLSTAADIAKALDTTIDELVKE